jgi:hypothetical protein
VPWLMHLDVYRQQLWPVLLGKEKPDLVGLDANDDKKRETRGMLDLCVGIIPNPRRGMGIKASA